MSGKTGHAEAIEIIYDSTKVSFDTLLKVFFDSHNPTTPNRQGPDYGTQYRYLFASLPDTEVVAISDLYEDNIKASMKILEKLNKPVDKIKTYWGGKNKWKTMLNEVKPDIVFISTDWNSHGEMAIETMKNNAPKGTSTKA